MKVREKKRKRKIERDGVEKKEGSRRPSLAMDGKIEKISKLLQSIKCKSKRNNNNKHNNNNADKELPLQCFNLNFS